MFNLTLRYYYLLFHKLTLLAMLSATLQLPSPELLASA